MTAAPVLDELLAGPQAPRYSTRRDPSARTAGPQVGIVAAALGTPLMPWQQLVSDVALELDPERPDRWRYPVVVVTVPRQAGKTTLVSTIAVHRALTRPRARIFMTAQTGKDARARWKDLADRVLDSPLADHAAALRGAGTESLTFPNRSVIRPFAPVRTALHGESPPLVVIDEAWAFDAARGEDLMGAIRPAQITLPSRQLWLISTAGTDESAFLREWVEVGRAAVDDPSSGVAYFEWSADDELDAYDPETWAFHPALGHTIDVGDLAAEAERATRGTFERAYLNRWTVTGETIIDLDVFDRRRAEQTPPPGHELAIGYEVAGDRSRSSIYAAWVDPAGRTQLHTVLVRDGAGWLPAELLRLRDELRPRVFMADDGGPSRQVTDIVRRAGLPVETLTFRDFATASGALLAGLGDGTVEHDGSPALREAFERAALKFVGDQRALDRRRSSGPIDPAIAAAVAAWAATHAPAPAPRPVFRGAA